MQRLVNLIQLLVVLVMLYPLFYVWEKDKVDTICRETQAGGMNKATFLQLAQRSRVRVDMPDTTEGRWTAYIESRASFSGYHCEVRGFGERLGGSRIVKDKPASR